MSSIVVEKLEKRYGQVLAVDGLDLEVHPGEIFGLIGPDGAGKTSTFHILSGVMAPTSGRVEVLGTTARLARERVGYLTQAFSLYLDLSVRENLDYMGSMRRLKPAEIEERALRYLRLFDLDRFGERLTGSLSGGMKQKLALAAALLAEPQLLLLDEPTTGVDPVSRREFWDTLAELSADGMTIVVATPYLDEAERCHRVALMYAGKVQRLGTPEELRKGLGLSRLELRAADLEQTEAALTGLAGIVDVQRFGDRLDVMVVDPVAGEAIVREKLGDAIEKLSPARPTLENVFVAALREQQHGGPIGKRPSQQTYPKGGVAIAARGLRKVFDSFVAVAGLQLEIHYGEIYGLLGANGAGKTTSIKMLCGLLEPSGGTVELAGGDASSREVRSRVGYMSQKFSLYDDLTIKENLDFFAGIYGVAASELKARQDWVLRFAGLSGRQNTLTGDLPGGWKQRVAFGAAILHDPKVAFLDEPTSGVDPIARRAFWKEINNLADAGVAVLVTTHYLEEAEQCNRLGFMVAGELVAEGTPGAVKAQQKGHLIEIYCSAPQQASKFLKARLDDWRVSLFGDRLHVIVDEEPQAGIARLKALLQTEHIDVVDAQPQPFSLEDVFIALVEQARARGNASPSRA